MSLITLTSKQNNADPRPTDPAIIKNAFRDGITIRKGSEVALINLSISKQGLFEVPAGQDNQIVFRIGDRATYAQRVAVIPPGNYTGSKLAELVETAMNDATLIGVYKGTWTCNYSINVSETFKINYGVNPLPSPSGPTLTAYDGILDIIKGDDKSRIISNIGGGAFGGKYPPNNIATGNIGVFGNGGEVVLVAKPMLISSIEDWDNAFFLYTNWRELVTIEGNTVVTVFTIQYTVAGGTGPWRWKLTGWGDGRPDEYLTPQPDSIGNGVFKHSYNLATDPFLGTNRYFSPDAFGTNSGALSDISRTTLGTENTSYSYNDTTNILYYNLPQGNSWTQNNNVNFALTFSIVPEYGQGTSEFIYKCDRTNLGVVQQTTWFRLTNNSGPLSYEFVGSNTLPNDGTPKTGDAVLDIVSNPATPRIQIAGGAGYVGSAQVNGVLGITPLIPERNLGYYGCQQTGYCRNQLYTGRTDYPGNVQATIQSNVGGYDLWVQVKSGGDLSNEVFFDCAQLIQTQGTNFPNANWRTQSGYIFQNLELTQFNLRGATDWTTYNPNNQDNIQMTIDIRGITGLRVLVSHDTQGDNTFIDEQVLADSTVATGQPAKITSRIKENHYPLRPVYAISNGGYYPDELIVSDVSGIFDTKENVPNMLVTMEHEPETEEELNAVPTVLTKSALYKIGYITVDTIGNGTDQIPALDYAGEQGNMADIMGFNSFYVFPAGQLSNPIESSKPPVDNISEPSLFLELFDFNITGHNGNTGDRCKVIAVIPKEELTSGATKGVLHYYPNFPVFIDLNMVEDKTFYDLNAILRAPDGTIANDLVNPTEVTLFIRESEETRQRKLMVEQAEILASVLANKNEAKINQIGINNPLI